MPSLYEALTWTVDEPAEPHHYVFHSNGELIANGTRLPTRRPEDAGVPYANPHAGFDDGRVLICVAAPDGAPYFYLDRTISSTSRQPVHVVAPNGAPIGSINVEIGGISGMFSVLSGKRGSVFVLSDANRHRMATYTSPSMRKPRAGGTLADSSGAEIAHLAVDRSPNAPRRRCKTMHLRHPLPEPLRTLVIATPIAVEMMISSPLRVMP
ncbi:hypothetical protein [Actinomadura terrae]|uniref:hypothetical protein n=1 Tax=Actinomadura terrae TaxID=604353 RepID=UPI001FA762A0|nr:hypothetical protein [Actinomadura terrae]